MKTDSSPLLAFLHIPKAGGTTIHRIIERNYSKDAIFTIRGMRVQESIEEFLALSPQQLARLEIVKGHFCFGLHEFVQRPMCYFTFLRHPVARVISSYYFILRTPHHTYHDLLVSRNMTLAQFVRQGVSKVATDNGQTRILAGWECLDAVDFGKCDRDMLEQAKINLVTHFDCIGLVEQFNRSLILARRAFHWNRLLYLKQNTMPRSVRPSVSDSTRQLIREANRLDMELYDFAAGLFQEAFARLGAKAELEVKLFELLNSLYAIVAPRYASVRSSMRQ
ncbi:MAG: sulfotransferase family protein [Chloroflexi bacterium]|nr:sulfotransferase family protein [Chloroflexota bacterium]